MRSFPSPRSVQPLERVSSLEETPRPSRSERFPLSPPLLVQLWHHHLSLGRRFHRFLPSRGHGPLQIFQFPQNLLDGKDGSERGHADQRHLEHGPWKGRLSHLLLSLEKKVEEMIQLIELKAFGLLPQGLDLFSGQDRLRVLVDRAHLQEDEIPESL